MVKIRLFLLSPELLTLLQPNERWYIIIYRSVVWKKIDSLWSRSRPQRNFQMSTNVCPDNIFWATEHFITKLDIVMHYHEPEWRDWFAVFKVKVTVKASYSRIMIFHCLLNCWSFCNKTWFNGISWIVFSFLFQFFFLERLDYFVVFEVKVKQRFKIWMNVHLDALFSTAEPFVTKLGIVMQHHGPECHAERLFCYFLGEGHNDGKYVQILLFLPYLLNCW